MNIVYFVFGQNIQHYQQVFFSIYTALANKDVDDRIIVLAENPDFLKQVEDCITIIPIDQHLLTQWKGQYDYFFRVKIKALEYIATTYPNQDILFLDGDTFVYQSLSLIKKELSKGQHFMHLNEGALPSLSTKSEKKLWSQIKHKKFGGMQIDEQTCMWNSGVLAISSNHFETIDLALKITDDMCAANVTCFTMEQLAFTIASNYYSPLKPADHIVGHYWGNKEEMNTRISDWINRAMMTNLTIDEMIVKAKEFPFNEIPIYVKHSNTYKRLSKKMQNLFKAKNHQYIQQNK